MVFVLCGDVVYSTNGHVCSASELSARELVVMCVLLFDDWDSCPTANAPERYVNPRCILV